MTSPTDAATPAELASAPLIAHILERYHAVHRRELPELCALARKVEAAHDGHAARPAGLADFLSNLNAELFCHMQREEAILFPMMEEGGHPMIQAPIAVMQSEHDDHERGLRTLARLTGDFAAPEDACGSWRALYAGLRKLSEDLSEHIRLENEVLFPRFIR